MRQGIEQGMAVKTDRQGVEGDGWAMLHGGRGRDCAISSTHLQRCGHAREQSAAAGHDHEYGRAARRARRSSCREGFIHQPLAVMACVGLLSLARAHGEGDVVLGVRGRTGVCGYVEIYTYTYTYIRIYIYVCIYMCMYMYIYIYM